MCVFVCVTFLPPGEQVSGGGVLVMFKGLEPQLEGEEPRILIQRQQQRVHANIDFCCSVRLKGVAASKTAGIILLCCQRGLAGFQHDL